MDKIWDRKSFEVGGHWPLWRGWKNRMTTQNRQKSNAKNKEKFWSFIRFINWPIDLKYNLWLLIKLILIFHIMMCKSCWNGKKTMIYQNPCWKVTMGFFLQSQHILGKKCALSCTLYQRNATGPPYLDTNGVCNLSLTVLRKKS